MSKRIAPNPLKRPPPHPGEFLIEDFLKPLAITQTAFANRISISPAYLSDIINGRRGVSAEMALCFEATLGMPASFWLKAQSNLDLYTALNDKVSQQRIRAVEVFPRSMASST